MATDKPKSDNDEWSMVDSESELSLEEWLSDDEDWLQLMTKTERLKISDGDGSSGIGSSHTNHSSQEKSPYEELAQPSPEPQSAEAESVAGSSSQAQERRPPRFLLVKLTGDPSQPRIGWPRMEDAEYYAMFSSLMRSQSSHSLWNWDQNADTRLLDQFNYDFNILHMVRYGWLCKYPGLCSRIMKVNRDSNTPSSFDSVLQNPLGYLQLPFPFWNRFWEHFSKEAQNWEHYKQAPETRDKPSIPTIHFAQLYSNRRGDSNLGDFFLPIANISDIVIDTERGPVGYQQIWHLGNIYSLINLVRRDIDEFSARRPPGFDSVDFEMYVIPRLTTLHARLTTIKLDESTMAAEIGLDGFH